LAVFVWRGFLSNRDKIRKLHRICARINRNGRDRVSDYTVHTDFVLKTEIVDDWLSPMSKILEHLAIAVCLWILFRQENFSSAKM